ncbi:dephospho-CoA kinase [Robertmurraya korlensis]|uniref:dephospho-CoA kinase n=1 Tax=Robertmurraya korlensis TaxID=519977 RepID=UPI002041BB8F|nr:dephospho-CoA kinase [Robertmurraya korlensis]MCM3599273.1 dephospho-CoA kinase [Robertmurraya korlensis]
MTLVVGLTGGIASGKSTVANMFKEMGIEVIDADVEARKAVEIGEEAYEQIVTYFGEGILNADHTINRSSLGEIIFNDSVKRQKLNEIVHPDVRSRMNEKKEAAVLRGDQIVVLDIPLLFESGLKHMVNVVLLVYVEKDVQLQRLMDRNLLTKEEALARIQSQMPIEDKRKLADKVLNNNGSIEDTKKQLIELLADWKTITN